MNEIDRMLEKFRQLTVIRTYEDVRKLEEAIADLFDVAQVYRSVAAQLEWKGTGDERRNPELEEYVDQAAHHMLRDVQEGRA